MQVIALTGGIGSGKSTVSSMFVRLGAAAIDLDIISHQLTGPNQTLVKKISSAFGDTYITDDGALNRTKMRKLVFGSPSAREKLNAILHPAIYNRAVEMLKSFSDQAYVVLEIPLLLQQSDYHQLIDKVLAVDCTEQIQIKRVQERNQLSKKTIEQIIQAQPSKETLLDMADDVLINNKSMAKLRENVHKLHLKYINTCIIREKNP